MVAFFDDLPDLSLIEIFSYLSCVNAVLTFSNLNTRLTALLNERGFYRHVNLSSARYHEFQSILYLFRLNEIESLVIDRHASPFQLKSWPYLPRLRTLSVKGVRELADVFKFAKKHANTLTHLAAESSNYSSMNGITKDVCYPSWNLCDFVRNVTRHLPAVQSLDFGIDASFHLHYWPFKTIQTHLTYLRIILTTLNSLLNLMITHPLSRTLQQLHITICDVAESSFFTLPNTNLWPRMEVLHTFTFVKSFNWQFSKEWTLVDTLTSSNVMSMLRRTNFCIVIDSNDLHPMYYSALFTDYRHVDVNYAFMINDNRQHIELSDYVKLHSQSNRRQIASATFISGCWPDNQLLKTSAPCYSKKPKNRQHLFYTVPWIFKEFVTLCVPDRCISNLQVFASSSQVNHNGSCRLIKLTMSDNLPPFIMFLPHIMSSNQIVELHLIRCDRGISGNLPSLSHLILTDSFDSLNTCSLLTNIRSIQITLHRQCRRFKSGEWTALRTLSTLPLLISLRILLYDMHIPPDDASCQIIAETAPMVSDFCFCFRRLYDQHGCGNDVVYTKQALFIEQLRNRILALPLNELPYVVVEKDGYGLIIWF